MVESVVLLWQVAQARSQQASDFQEAVLGQRHWYWHLLACEEHLENMCIYIYIFFFFQEASAFYSPASDFQPYNDSMSLDSASALRACFLPHGCYLRPKPRVIAAISCCLHAWHFHHYASKISFQLEGLECAKCNLESRLSEFLARLLPKPTMGPP